MKLTMLNGEALDRWMAERRKRDGASIRMTGIKGPPPEGATYDDGVPIVHPINIAWRDENTGEVFDIEYAQEARPHA